MAGYEMNIGSPIPPEDTKDVDMAETFSPPASTNAASNHNKSFYGPDDYHGSTEDKGKETMQDIKFNPTDFSNAQGETTEPTTPTTPTAEAKSNQSGTKKKSEQTRRKANFTEGGENTKKGGRVTFSDLIKKQRYAVCPRPIQPKEMVVASTSLDMIGEASYLDLNKLIRNIIEGEYAIIFSRPSDLIQDVGFQGDLYKPDGRNKVLYVYTSKKTREMSVWWREINNGLNRGYWGVAILAYNGRYAYFYLGHVNGDIETKISAITDPINHMPGLREDKKLDKIMEMGFQEKGSTAHFGIKNVIEDKHLVEYGCWGYEFARLTLACWDLETGEKSAHLLVAVKFSDKIDVGSYYILSQCISFPDESYLHYVQIHSEFKPRPSADSSRSSFNKRKRHPHPPAGPSNGKAPKTDQDKDGDGDQMSFR